MTVTLAWWWIPLAVSALGFVLPIFFKQQGDYDMFTPFLKLASFVGCQLVALAVIVGHWLA